MFIPIDAKADIADSKKGKLTPSQHAQLNAWCLGNKTGILDWGGKCTYKNISVDATTHTATILFNKGYVVICGRLVECEQDTSFTIDIPITSGTTETTYIVLQYNLGGSGIGEFGIAQRSNTRGVYPFVGSLKQQDLNDDPITGLYEFVLYECNATSTSVTLTRNINYVKSVEQRLEDLGFKQGSIETSVSTTQNLITRQGNYVIGNLAFYGAPFSGTLPAEFRPKTTTKIGVYHSFDISAAGLFTGETGGGVTGFITFSTDGTVIYSPLVGSVFAQQGIAMANARTQLITCNFGYEATPI